MAYDIILKGGQIIDVVLKRLYRGNIFIKDHVIVKISEEPFDAGDENIIDISGKFVAPGFVDSHLHIESSMLNPIVFSQEAIKHGTTSVFVDPHEITNVMGMEGINLFIEQSSMVPIDIFVGIPSCVPATDLEDSGASISIDDIRMLAPHQQIFGLAEMMNFPGIIHDLGDARKKCDIVFDMGKVVDGHCPGLTGENLEIYITNGKKDGVARITSDHQTSTYEEAIEKIGQGMTIALRYGSASKDLDRILPGLLRNRIDLSNFMLCSDDIDLIELHEKGHMNRIIRRAKEIIKRQSGLPDDQAAILAISLATINPAKYFSKFFKFHNLPQIGEVAEGKKANLVVLSSLVDLDVEKIIANGIMSVDEKQNCHPAKPYDYTPFSKKINIGKAFSAGDFKISYNGKGHILDVRVIEIIENSIRTREIFQPLKVKNTEIKPDQEKDIAKIAVIERHKATGSYSLGFVKGLGIKNGAVATTISHDSHNLVAVGMDDNAMASAVNYLSEKGGGMVVVTENHIQCFPLSIGGLMSTSTFEEAVKDYKKLMNSVKKTGSTLSNLFMEIGFLSLPVIPELRITNRGLVNVDAFKFVEIF